MPGTAILAQVPVMLWSIMSSTHEHVKMTNSCHSWDRQTAEYALSSLLGLV